MSICDNCIHLKVCGHEGVEDEAMTYCADALTRKGMSLIDVEALKEMGATCFARRNENGKLEAIISIDNVPTVDISKEVWNKSNELLNKRLSYLGKPQGDLISREALLKELYDMKDHVSGEVFSTAVNFAILMVEDAQAVKEAIHYKET